MLMRVQVTILMRRPEDEMLLLASDGLWDVLSNQEAVNLAKRCLKRARQRGASRQSAGQPQTQPLASCVACAAIAALTSASDWRSDGCCHDNMPPCASCSLPSLPVLAWRGSWQVSELLSCLV